MDKEFTDEQLKEQLEKRATQAEELLKDEDKMERFLERFERKLKKVPAVGNKLSNLPVLVSLIRAYVKKDYRDLPIGSIIAIVGALIYFVSLIDILPDPIPIFGYVDDVAVFGFVLKMVEDDVTEYKEWQKKNGKRALED